MRIKESAMVNETRDDLKAFHQFIGEQIANGGASLTPAEAFDLWETLHPSDAERAATVEALKEALDDMRDGDTGIPARDFFTDLRSKYNLPARS
jgi:hypothetical protein